MNQILTEQFGDTPELTDIIADLIVRGIKTATCSAYIESKDKIHIGHQVVVLNSQNIPVCIIETTGVNIVPFNQITVMHAYLEGEGDRTLRYWQQEHHRYFKEKGIFSPDMLLLCEYFKVIKTFT